VLAVSTFGGLLMTIRAWRSLITVTKWSHGIWLPIMTHDRRSGSSKVSTVKFGGVGIMVWGWFSWFDLGLLVPVKGNLNTTAAYNYILDNSVLQLCGNSLGKYLSCFSMTMPPCTKLSPYRNGLSRSVWKNLTGLHRALNADCRARSNHPTSVPT
jgi:hypothetical protein